MNLNFRDLRADETDVRVAKITDKGVQLLIYKDARVDMNILDETVGQANWQRDHFECKGNLYCKVGINCGSEWVWKADAGAESFSDAEKGEASDSFKRACVNWGIGRELYTAPFIWVSAAYTNIEKNNQGKWVCKDSFAVEDLVIKDKKIIGLSIKSTKTNQYLFEWGRLSVPNTQPKAQAVPQGVLTVPCARCGKETDIAKTKKAKNNKTGATMDICPECAKECGVK